MTDWDGFCDDDDDDVKNCVDNCINTSNTDQANYDGDAW